MENSYFLTRDGQQLVHGTLPKLTKSLEDISKTLNGMLQDNRDDQKKFAECIFDLTLTANFLIGCLEDDREFDTRAVFDEVYDLARQFHYGGMDVDDGNYITRINDFGEERLRRFFNLD